METIFLQLDSKYDLTQRLTDRYFMACNSWKGILAHNNTISSSLKLRNRSAGVLISLARNEHLAKCIGVAEVKAL